MPALALSNWSEYRTLKLCQIICMLLVTIFEWRRVIRSITSTKGTEFSTVSSSVV